MTASGGFPVLAFGSSGPWAGSVWCFGVFPSLAAAAVQALPAWWQQLPGVGSLPGGWIPSTEARSSSPGARSVRCQCAAQRWANVLFVVLSPA
jgi:hypothetical protein